MLKQYDVVVIGGGPAGLAASISAKKEGSNVCLIEREAKLGGILKQCIHDGFGIVRFKEKLSGPEYAQRFIDEFNSMEIEAYLLTFVTRIEKLEEGFRIVIVNREGVNYLETKAIVLATGCRERTAKQVNIHGTRPSGVFTAGNAQNFMNLMGQKVAKKCVILGSGDIGLIMARRLTLEGSEVVGVYEAKAEPSGLTRNLAQCLNDFNIPLHLSTTVTRVFGAERVEGVEIAKVDSNMQPIKGTEEYIECDTLILSVGLIPENELAETLGVELGKNNGPVCDSNFETNVKGVFSCGNSLHVYDLVDYVSESGEKAGHAASLYVKGELPEATDLVEDKITEKKALLPEGKIICIVCPKGCEISIRKEGDEYITEGNTCKRGHDFAIQELTLPTRTICSTVRTEFKEKPVLPVRVSSEIPKDKIFDVMEEINKTVVTTKVKLGDVIIENVLGLGADVIATTNID